MLVSKNFTHTHIDTHTHRHTHYRIIREEVAMQGRDRRDGNTPKDETGK